MTFNLGQAQLNLVANDEQLVIQTAKAYRDIQNKIQTLSKVISIENELRKEDTLKSLGIILQGHRKQAQEEARLARESIREQIAQRRVLLEANKKEYNEDVAAKRKAEADKLKAERDAIKEQLAARKVYLDANKRAYAEEQKAIKEALKEREKAERELAQARAKAERDANAVLKQLRQENTAAEKVIQQQEADALKQRNARAKAIRDYESTLEKERLAEVNRTLREEAALRNRMAQQRAAQAKAAALAERTSGGGALSAVAGIGNAGSLAATLLGFGAIASGAVIARAAVINMSKAITDSEQSAKALNAAFGNASSIFEKAANSNAEAFNKINSEVQKGTAYFGILQKQYGITGEEIKRLIPIAIQLQKEFGGELTQVFRDVSNAIQGETQALEKYGIALQFNAIRNNDLLTDSEKRLYSTMTITEQGRIRMRVLEAESIKRKSQEVTGIDKLSESYNKFARAQDEFFKAMAAGLAGPSSDIINWISDYTIRLSKFMDRNRIFAEESKKLREERGQGWANTLALPMTPEEIQTTRERVDARFSGTDKASRDAESKAIIEDYKRTQEGLAKVERDAAETKLERQGVALRLQVDAAHKAEIRRLDDAIDAANAEKVARLDALEATYKAEKKTAEDVEYIRQQASDLQLDRIQKERDELLRAAEDRRDTELEQLRVQSEAQKNATEEAIRQENIKKDRRQKANEGQRDNDIEQLERGKVALERARKEEDYLIEQSVTKQKRRLDSNHQSRLEQFEKEKDKVKEAYDTQIKGIEDLIYKEEERHRKRNRQIDDELKKQQRAIDLQIKGIEDAANARENAQRRAELSEKVTSAQQELTQAQGTGTPEEVAAANQKLVGAIRIGNPVAVKKAQEELIAISGKSNAAILEAQKKLSAAQQELNNEGLKQAEETEKERLQNKKDSLDDEADKLKRKEEDDNRRRKRALDADKDAEKKKFDEFSKRLEERKKKEDKTFEDNKQKLDDSIQYAKKKQEEGRKNEDIALDATRKAIDKRYKTEQDLIEETFDSEEKGSIPTLRRAQKDADEKYEAMQTAARKRYEAEQREIHNTYDDPVNGLIASHKRAEEAARREYTTTTALAAAAYETARQSVERAFNAPDKKSGIIDKLNLMKEAADEKLEQVHQAFEAARKGLVEEGGVIKIQWDKAKELANEYFDLVKKRATEKPDTRFPSTTSGGIRNPGGNENDQPSGNSGSGTGSTSLPTHTSNTGTPSTTQGQQTSIAIPADDVSKMFTTSFGYGSPYSGQYTPGPGWSGKAAWPNGPSHHKGVDLIYPEPGNGRGKPVPAFYPGRVLRTVADSSGPGGNMVIIEDGGGRTHWYLHLDKYSVTAGQQVKRGDVIATLGGTGTEEFPHLHYEVRQGDNNGPATLDALRAYGIDPMPYVRGRDSGYLFRNPTITQDLRTGERNLLAERGPERLLGRVATQQMESMGLRRALGAAYSSRAESIQMDQSGIGAALATIPTMITNNTKQGDVFNYKGVAPEDIFNKFRNDQRRQRVLRGA